MPAYHILWMSLAIVSSTVGLIGVICCRCGCGPAQTCWGRRLFLLMLFASGVGSIAAACRAYAGLPYLGLAFAGLVIAMVWENPQRRPTQHWLPKQL